MLPYTIHSSSVVKRNSEANSSIVENFNNNLHVSIMIITKLEYQIEILEGKKENEINKNKKKILREVPSRKVKKCLSLSFRFHKYILGM